MKIQPILYGIVGLVIGVVLTGFVMASQTKPTVMESDTTTKTENTQMNGESSMSMQDMMDSLKGKKGEEFDKAFMSAMIVHHQNAIDMAKEAQMNAGKDEIKQMADDIITAQEKEIQMMRQWQKDWGMNE